MRGSSARALALTWVVSSGIGEPPIGAGSLATISPNTVHLGRNLDVACPRRADCP